MDKHDEQLEHFLREFVPERPGALCEDRRPAVVWQRRLAAAAVLALVCAMSLWFATSRSAVKTARLHATKNLDASPVNRPLSVAYLERLALEDPTKFDAVLTAASQDTLPSFTGPNSLLAVLAKD
jgi:hypothetical protein